MAVVFFNNEQLEIEINNNAKIIDIKGMIQSQYLKENESITEMVIDGKSYNPTQLDLTFLESKTNQYQYINFLSEDVISAVYHSIQASTSHIDAIIELIHETNKKISQNKIKESHELFLQLTEAIQLFVELTSKVVAILIGKKIIEPTFFSQHFSVLEGHLISTLRAILTARENNDIMLLSDLLEYELVDNLNQWKTKLLPILTQVTEKAQKN